MVLLLLTASDRPVVGYRMLLWDYDEDRIAFRESGNLCKCDKAVG